MEERSNKLTEVVIGQDDVRNLRDFFRLFEVEMTPELDKHMTFLESKPENITLQSQEVFRALISDAFLKSKHAMFKDELFVEPLKECERIVFDHCFQQELTDSIGVEEESK